MAKCFIHDTAVIDDGVEIGEETKIWHFSHVLGGSRIGSNCNIGQNVVVGPDVSIGNHCKIQNNVSVYKGVTLEEGVFCGPSMVFTNVFNPRSAIRRMDEIRPTRVKKGASLVKGNIKEAVLAIKQQPGKDIWLFGGAGLTASLMNLNLVDEIGLAVHPVLLGGGKPLFKSIKDRINLALAEVKTYDSGLVALTYRLKET